MQMKVAQLYQFRYGLRYIAKCLKNLLKDKFPDTPEEEVLKVE